MAFLSNHKRTLSLLMLTFMTSHSLAQQSDPRVAATYALKKLSMEELLNVEVTSVSRTAETLNTAAAAIAVVSNEELQRSGATSIPEALRLIPGLHVAQQDANTWAVSSRGFSSINSEKLLVLSDTRSIYTPLYSGVFWDVQDYLLEDIERIEVIRGPGAALWGSNAVNGVINISSKTAQDTQGSYLEASTGSEQTAVAARYGGKTNGDVYYRVFAKHTDRDDSLHPNSNHSDAWRLTHVGFRSDWHNTQQDSFNVQGDLYRGDIGQLAPSVAITGRAGPQGRLHTKVSGGNVLARWRRAFSDTSDLQLRVYYDRTHRNDSSFIDDLDTVDIDLQHRFALTPRQQIIWGASYRYTHNRNVGKVIFAVEPASSTDQLFSGFVQDQIAWTETLQLTLGSKFEHNDFSGFEVQPSARLSWNLSPQQTLWSAVSRAVRVPTRLERDIAIDVTNPAGNPIARLLGNRQFDSEKLLAYELGYRWQALPNLTLDLAGFDNRYQGLSSLERGTPFIDARDGRTVIPIVNQNQTDGRALGVEALLNYSPLPSWRLSFSYSNVDLDLEPHGQDINRGRFLEGATPRHQYGVRSMIDLTERWQFDAQFRYQSAIRTLPDIVSGTGLAGYAELDLHLAWQASPQLEFTVTGQNLLHPHHVEFGTPEARGEIERSVQGKMSWHF